MIRKRAVGAAILAKVLGTVRTKSVFAMAKTAGIKNGSGSAFAMELHERFAGERF